MYKFGTLIFLYFVICISLSAKVLYVDATYNGTPQNGSFSNPYITIQQALSVSQNMDTIKVAQGLYNENLTFPENQSLVLLGGYQKNNFTNRSNQLYSSIINGNNNKAVVSITFSGGNGSSAYYEIDGFTIQGGQRGIDADDWKSGGICSIKIANNIIQDNGGLTSPNDYGGGIYVRMKSEIRNNIIRNNTCGKGGGVYIGQYSINETFVFENNRIENNKIFSDHGAGAYIAGKKGTIINNTFTHNVILESWGWGGGLIVDGGMYHAFTNEIFVLLQGNTYAYNSTPSGGSGVFIDEGANVRMKNELIYKNSCSGSFRNGALYVDGNRANQFAKTILDNCTIANNTGAEYSYGHAIFIEGGSEVIAKNSIFWGNSSTDSQNDFYVHDNSSLTIEYSIYQSGKLGDGIFNTTNSFNSDPLFADTNNDNYYLKSLTGRWNPSSLQWVIDNVHSPAIDTGNPLSEYIYEPDANGGRVNIGCYGNSQYASKSIVNAMCKIENSTMGMIVYADTNTFSSNISFDLPADGFTKLQIIDLNGRIKDVLVNGFLEEGKHIYTLNTNNLNAGYYFCSLQYDNNTSIVKFVVDK
jgi:hypothetical protein